MNDWEYIKEFYKEHFGIDKWVVEMLANRDILLLCASGASNKTISRFLEISEAEIELVIKEAFSFPGWGQDLPCNPYKMMQDSTSTAGFESSIRTVLVTYPEFSNVKVEDVVSLCYTMSDIDERIYDEWI